MPSKMKQAIVTPLLKKPTLSSDELKNYRPVLNLSFVSKLTEKVVAARLIAHLQRYNLQEPLQSAYRQYCSIETALLKVQNEILHILDKRNGAALLLLDLSAAFDTIDHGILLHTLPTRSRHYRRVSEVDKLLSQRQESSCSHIRKAVGRHSTDMWGPSKLGTGTSPVFNLHYSAGSYHQKSRSVVPSVC